MVKLTQGCVQKRRMNQFISIRKEKKIGDVILHNRFDMKVHFAFDNQVQKINKTFSGVTIKDVTAIF